MPTTVYNSTDTPITVVPYSSENSYITIPDSGNITNITCYVDCTADFYEYLSLALAHGLATSNSLQNGSPLALNGVTFDTDRLSENGMNSTFSGTDLNGSWWIQLVNYYGVSNAVINSWNLSITYDAPPEIIVFPNKPVKNISKSFSYGTGLNIKKNYNFNFKNFNEIKKCDFSGTIENIFLSVIYSGDTTNNIITLYKISNGVRTAILDRNLILKSGLNYYSLLLNNKKKLIDDGDIYYNNIFNKGDLFYIDINQSDSNIRNLNVSFTVKSGN